MLSIVVAVGKNNIIGKENGLLWHLPNDLKHFRKITEGHTIIMGRKTFESIGRVLPNRRHIVLTRSSDFQVEGVEKASSIEEVLKLVENEEEAFVIGGGEIYRQFLPLVQRIYMTEVDIEKDADVFFPAIDSLEWKVVEEEPGVLDERNTIPHRFLILERVERS
ncbi:MAG: dihydrofolate reductase [Bacillota bacterium]|jgi:dihydrofolate reductase|nr:dihydrofolate reductase [Bacillota bacterium]HOA91456.1 dihydrofolate reductase [Bacillota bacterium]HOJ46847.1 dihydrofolate reductase [Bacillota bacterium]HOL13220.1 dihydrofolate reductase [Bacillota bacterium]HOP53609.1 dihydrofolate reductase [Bacillota bacterium]